MGGEDFGVDRTLLGVVERITAAAREPGEWRPGSAGFGLRGFAAPFPPVGARDPSARR